MQRKVKRCERREESFLGQNFVVRSRNLVFSRKNERIEVIAEMVVQFLTKENEGRTFHD